MPRGAGNGVHDPQRPSTVGPVRLLLAVLLSSLASAYSGTVRAQISDDLIRIGVLNDQSGVYADFGGPGSVIAARMAVEDAGTPIRMRSSEICALTVPL